jgi:Uma2 family endonuclease
MSVATPTRRFTVAEYHRMGEVGILREDERVELIEGEIVKMTAIGRQHATYVRRLNRLLSTKFSDVVLLDVQNPVTLAGHSEPQPDAVLLKPKPDDYLSGHPTPEDVLLLVEVSDSSLAFDREVKVPLYARPGIREVWLVDVEEQSFTIYRGPTPSGYTISFVLRRGDRIAPLAFPDRDIAIDDILR